MPDLPFLPPQANSVPFLSTIGAFLEYNHFWYTETDVTGGEAGTTRIT